MNTLIIGCGFLGLRVAREILKLDPSAEVVGATRTDRRHPELIAAGVKPILIDVAETTAFDSIELPSQIVHCVGFDRSSGQSQRSVMVDGMIGLSTRLKRDSWTGRFVHISSTGVYGQTDGSWVDEYSPTEPTTESGRACLDAELFVGMMGLNARMMELRSRMSLGLQIHSVTIRLVGLYGPGRIIGLGGITRGDPIHGEPERWLNLIHVDDAARAVVAALTIDDPRELYLACDDRPVKRREYYETLARRLGAPAPRFLPSTAVEPDKRVRNTLLREELGVIPKYPDFLAGLDDALGDASGS